MAKKLLLDGTSRPKGAYSAFTAGYRQSDNVEDQRPAQFRPSETPRSVATVLGRRTTETAGGAADGYDDGATGYDHSASISSTRKVDPEEAIRRTHTERK